MLENYYVIGKNCFDLMIIVILFNILDDRIGDSDCFKLVVYGIFCYFVDLI